jgi:DNA-binding LacI/PurR family transcriptional regulator
MKKTTRHRTILELISDAGQQLLSTKDLALNLHVSEATIRRDLQELAVNGQIQRQHGGVLQTPRSVTLQDNGEIGLLFGSRIDKFKDPFYNLVLEGVDRKLQEYGYRSAYMRTFHDIQTPEHAAELLRRYPVDGIIFIGTSSVASIDFIRQHVPLIVTITHQRENFNEIVLFDGEAGMRSVVEHVIGRGYRRIGFITGGVDERLHGYKAALNAHDLPVDNALIHIIDSDRRGWVQQVGELGASELMRLEDPPDAICCASDRLAIGAMRWLQQHGYRIPQDIAVTGFDNIPDAEFTYPPLTTVNVHKELMGELAAERMVRRIENPNEIPLHIIVPTELVVRESCGSCSE